MVKNVFLTIVQIGVLYGFYLVGTLIQQTFHLVIPGSMVGMLLFFTLLFVWKPFERFIEKGTRFVLAHLPLFFTPAIVGIIVYFNLFQGQGLWLIVITIVSTLIVFIASAYTARIVQRFLTRSRGQVRG